MRWTLALCLTLLLAAPASAQTSLRGGFLRGGWFSGSAAAIDRTRAFYGSTTCPTGWVRQASGQVYTYPGRAQQPEDQCLLVQPRGNATAIGPCALCTGSTSVFPVWGSTTCPSGDPVYTGKQYLWGANTTDGQCWQRPPSSTATVLGSCAVCTAETSDPGIVTIGGTSTCPDGSTLLYAGSVYLGSANTNTSLTCWQHPPLKPSSSIGSCAVCSVPQQPYLVADTTCPFGSALTTGRLYRYADGGQLDHSCWKNPPAEAGAQPLGPCSICYDTGLEYVFQGAASCPAGYTEGLLGHSYTISPRGLLKNVCWARAPQVVSAMTGSCAVCQGTTTTSTSFGSATCPSPLTTVAAGHTYLCSGHSDGMCWLSAPSYACDAVADCAYCQK